MPADSPIVVIALYKFVELIDHQSLQPRLQAVMDRLEIRGTLLLAGEGINGTVAGSRAGVDALLEDLRRDPRLADLEVKEAIAPVTPFRRGRVRIKKEIVTMGVDNIDPNDAVGTYVDPQHWNDLIDDPEVLLIDTRNDYETSIGSFAGAVDPQTQSFRELPEYLDKHLDPKRHKKVAMYCTGGIRCEKSTAYLKQRGFEDVYHLRGGILKYLETVPVQQSRWKGRCFVFDQRVSVGHDLQVGRDVMCFGCGWPVTPEGQSDPRFIDGVQCPHCADLLTDQQRQRFAMRHRQKNA